MSPATDTDTEARRSLAWSLCSSEVGRGTNGHHLLSYLVPGPPGGSQWERAMSQPPSPRQPPPGRAGQRAPGVSHGRFLCLVSHPRLCGARGVGSVPRDSGGRQAGGVAGWPQRGGPGAGSDAIFQAPLEAGPSRCVHGDLPLCPFRTTPVPPLCPGCGPHQPPALQPRPPGRRRHGARMGPTSSKAVGRAACCRRPDGA